MRYAARLVVILALLWPAVAVGQVGDDRSRIVTFLEGQLSDAARQVRIEGFRGALSAQAEIDLLTIADAQGVWLRLEGARLDWSRAALLRGALQIDALQATTLEILRRPEPAAGPDIPPAAATPFRLPELPVSVSIGRLRVDRVTLGADLIGTAAALSIDGSASLAGGQGQADLAITRLDGPRGNFDLAASYANDSRRLALSLALTEDRGGLVATRLGLPDTPAIALQVMGDAPIDAFRAEIALSSDGAPRLTGEIATTRPADSGIRSIRADLRGDVTALFLPQYRPFFGPELAFSGLIKLAPDGAVVLEDLALSAAAMRLDGHLELAANGEPERFDLRLRLADPNGRGPVLLPLPWAAITLGAADLTLRHDAANGPDYIAQGQIRDLAAGGLAMGQLDLTAGGILRRSAAGLALQAPITLTVTGLDHGDAAMARALGTSAALRGAINWASGAPLVIRDLSMRAGDLALSGAASLILGAEGLDLETDFAVDIGDLARFAGLAGQPLAGRLAASAAVRASPLTGGFDMVLDGTARDLRLGAGLPDGVFAGQTDLTLSARRDVAGFVLRRLALTGTVLTLEAAGRVSDDGGLVTLTGRLADIGLFTDALSGPVTAVIDATRGPGGTAPWALRADVDSAAGVTARLAGTAAADTGLVDLTARGQLPLALANRALAPRSLAGRLDFDLSLVGRPALASLQGRLETSGARLSLPYLQTALEDIGLRGTLSDGQLGFRLAADQGDIGKIAASGTIDLTRTAFPAQIAVTGTGLRLINPTLYDARIAQADVSVTGALGGAMRVAGDVALGQTDLRVPESGLGAAAPIPPIAHRGETAAERRTRIAAGLGPAATRRGGTGNVALDLTITAPGRIFLRGRGVDAELGGQLQIGGTAAQIIPAGRFELIRGRLSILGTRLDLTQGTVSLSGGLDPIIDLLANSRSGDYLVGVAVTGPVSAPRITLSATPPLPEDEILAQLLFGRRVATLSPLQLIQMADAASALAGGSQDGGIVANLRASLGLDDLDLRTDEGGTAALRAGRYLSQNVYTDLTIGADGAADLSLNIDLTPDITARGGVSASGDTRLGVFFERDY